MRSLLVELSRFRSRRAVVGLVLAMVAITGAVMASIVYETRPLSAAEQTRAEQRFERAQEDVRPQIEDCRQDPEEFFGGPTDASECDTLAPELAWYTSRPALDLEETATSTVPGIGVLLASLAILVGATFAGADWTSGSMTNQLLFRPRRLRLWLAKATAVVLGSVVSAALVLAGFWAALLAVAQARGIAVPEPVWEQILRGSGRGLGLVAAAALGGFALTMWLRRTGGAIGLLFGAAVVTEIVVAVVPVERISQWSILNNLAAVAQNGTRVFDDSICEPSAACDPTYLLTFAHGAAVLGALLLAAVVVSVLTFRRRDVV